VHAEPDNERSDAPKAKKGS